MCQAIPARLVLALLTALAATQCGSAPESAHGTQILRAQPAGGGELFPTQTALNVPAESAALNEAARFLAGLPALQGRDVFAAMRATGAWQEHRARLDEAWNTFTARHGAAAGSWARSEIGDLRSARAVFYPFSGPDFLFAQIFYPGAESYILCGLEPCEPLPALDSLSADDIARGLEGLSNSMAGILQFSYFITKDMRLDLQATRFRGVLPVLLVFLARSGHAVESVDAARLDANGNPLVFAAGQGTVPGFLIRARGPSGPKRIFYFRQDLSNGSLAPDGPFPRFVAGFGRPAGLAKSASYLMHEDSFSNVRDFLLTRTCGLVQDPSGAPLRAIRGLGLRLELYGRYQNTLEIFRQYDQPDLAAACANHANPLGFGIGYLVDPRSSCLMVVRPR